MAARMKTMPCTAVGAWQTMMLGNAMVAQQMTTTHIVVAVWWKMS